MAETKASSRTWFGTLTFAPDEQERAKWRVMAKLARQGVEFERLSAHAQFVERHKELGKELTRYIKRVRKRSGAALRYLLVAEAHKSGLPHYHMLIHEAPLGGIVPHRHLSEAWTVGFERWRLSDPHNPRSAAYLCKYLSKSLSARVRASQRYGVAASDLHAFVVAQLHRLREEAGRRGEPTPALDPLFASLYIVE